MDKDREIANLRAELKDVRHLLDWWQREYEILAWDWQDERAASSGDRPVSLDEHGAYPPSEAAKDAEFRRKHSTETDDDDD